MTEDDEIKRLDDEINKLFDTPLRPREKHHDDRVGTWIQNHRERFREYNRQWMRDYRERKRQQNA